MGEREIIKDFYGRRIGEIRTDWRGNRIAMDMYGRILGNYDKKGNVTTVYPSGRIVASGDVLNALIWEEENKRNSVK